MAGFVAGLGETANPQRRGATAVIGLTPGMAGNTLSNW
jgi:hypothetical protein